MGRTMYTEWEYTDSWIFSIVTTIILLMALSCCIPDTAITQSAMPHTTTGIAQDMAAILAEQGINTTVIIHK